jgi:RNA polymerase sigma factor (sigma-70 family)
MGDASVAKEDARDLDEFVRTGSTEGFERLVRRYAGMVFAACLRRLGSREDAEDASQTVFAVLARRARTVRPEFLVSWLHGTCLRAVSATVRARERRARHEKEAAQMRTTSAQPSEPAWAEARRHLDAELDALPGKLREAVSRQYLAGQSRSEIARELGVPEGTVASRVNAGLERLRARLVRRGAALSATALAGFMGAEAAAPVPAGLIDSIQAVCLGKAASPAVTSLTKGVAKMIFWTKVKVVAAVISATITVGGSGVWTIRHLAAAAGEPANADWPCFRGPNRDGVAPSSPKLLDRWPKEGPKLLWKSAPIPYNAPKPAAPFGQAGGAGSPVVVGGKVFLYVDWRKTQPGPYVITTKLLKELGWEEGVPDDLAKKIEEARMSEKRNGPNNSPKPLAGAELDAYIKDFMATLDPQLAGKFGPHIKKRLEQGKNNVCSWREFGELSNFRDKEFKDIEELMGLPVLSNWHDGGVGKIFIRNALAEKAYTHADTVLCLDALTGKEIWRREFPVVNYSSIGPNWYFAASSTPTVSGDKCYATGSAGLYCLAVKDGAVIWQTKLKSGSNSAPLVLNGAVYVGLSEGTTAFNAANGQVLWTQPAASNCCSSPVLWTSGGKTYLICGGQGRVLFLEPEKGAALWGAHIGQDLYATPVISGDTMVTLGSYSWLTAWKITPQKAEQIWSDGKALGDRGASPLVYQEHVYHPPAESGRTLACLELKTGVRKWTQQIPGGVCSPVVVDGKIIASVTDSTMMVKATPEKFEELGRISVPKGMGTFASPAVAGGKLYMRLADGIVCYDLTAAGN